MQKVLIVEDVPTLASTYAAYLKNKNYDVHIASSGQEALALILNACPAAVILDINLPDMNGLDMLKEIRAKELAAEFIIITSKGSVNLAVDAMRLGAFDFIMKPFSAERLQVTVANALERNKMGEEKYDLKSDFINDGFGDFIGSSHSMQAVYKISESAAPTNATIFITGESGTGKELCASTIHKLSTRRNGPFVALNCGAIPKDLLESEIFGHLKGAFTGATSDRKGAALQAHGGTLFLDEIGEMDLTLQVKMLRFVQERRVQRLGEDTSRPVDIRIICATNRNPMAEVAAGRFREDLFYRLYVIPIEMPPLREREKDILLVAGHFLHQLSQLDGKKFQRFESDAEDMLMNYTWPGNIRELQNVIRRVVVLHDGDSVTASMLADMIPKSLKPSVSTSPDDEKHAARHFADLKGALEIRPLEDVIRMTIEAAIALCDGSVPKAAAALKVSPSTLYRRVQNWQMAADAEETSH